jgi:hypothetical protein
MIELQWFFEVRPFAASEKAYYGKLGSIGARISGIPTVNCAAAAFGNRANQRVRLMRLGPGTISPSPGRR